MPLNHKIHDVISSTREYTRNPLSAQLCQNSTGRGWGIVARDFLPSGELLMVSEPVAFVRGTPLPIPPASRQRTSQAAAAAAAGSIPSEEFYQSFCSGPNVSSVLEDLSARDMQGIQWTRRVVAQLSSGLGEDGKREAADTLEPPSLEELRNPPSKEDGRGHGGKLEEGSVRRAAVRSAGGRKGISRRGSPLPSPHPPVILPRSSPEALERAVMLGMFSEPCVDAASAACR